MEILTIKTKKSKASQKNHKKIDRLKAMLGHPIVKSRFFLRLNSLHDFA
jgi:hypothetical protein